MTLLDRRYALLGVLLIAPSVLIFCAVIVYPLVSAIYLSLFSINTLTLQGGFVGLGNYAKLAGSETFWRSLFNTFVWTIFTLALQIMFGILVALMLHQSMVFRSLARSLILFPYFVSTVVAVLVWRWLFNDLYGILNHMLMWAGVLNMPIDWLGSMPNAMISVILVGAWKYFPFVVIAVLARLQTIPEHLYGAGRALLRRDAAAAARGAARGHSPARHLGLQGVRPDLPVDRGRADHRDADAAALGLLRGLRALRHGCRNRRRRRHDAGDAELHGALPARRRSRGGRAMNRLAGRIAYNLFAWSIVLVVTFPLLWMIITSVKPQFELFRIPPTFLPETVTFEHYVTLIRDTPFLLYMRNSLIIAFGTTILVVVVATLGAHSLVRFRYPGRERLAQMVLFTYLLPSVVLLIPLYLLMVWIGVANSLLSLVIAYTTFALPYALWLLRSFMQGIPDDLESAALVDGATRMEAFVDVILPQALPGIISTSLFTFILAWNEYLFALVLVNTDAARPLTTGVMSMLISSFNIEWSLLMAASVMMSLPLVIIFAFLSSYLTRGFGAGGVKG
jgi:multiple sugar transport system permease protein